MSEEFGPDFITVTDEDGNDFELEHLDTLEYNNEVYMAFFPAVSEDAQEGEPADIDLDDEEYGHCGGHDKAGRFPERFVSYEC